MVAVPHILITNWRMLQKHRPKAETGFNADCNAAHTWPPATVATHLLPNIQYGGHNRKWWYLYYFFEYCR